MSNKKAVDGQHGGRLPGSLPGALVTDYLRKVLWHSCAEGVGLQRGHKLKVCKTWRAFNGQDVTQPQESLQCTKDALVKEAQLNQKDFDNCWSHFGLCVVVRMIMDVRLLSDPSVAAHLQGQIPVGNKAHATAFPTQYYQGIKRDLTTRCDQDQTKEPRLLKSARRLVNQAAATAKLDAKVREVIPLTNGGERLPDIVFIFQGLKAAESSSWNTKFMTGVVLG